MKTKDMLFAVWIEEVMGKPLASVERVEGQNGVFEFRFEIDKIEYNALYKQFLRSDVKKVNDAVRRMKAFLK